MPRQHSHLGLCCLTAFRVGLARPCPFGSAAEDAPGCENTTGGGQATLAAQSTTQNSSKRASYADGSWGQDGWISCPIECTYIEQPKRLLNERVQAAPRRPTLGVQLRDGQHQPSNDLMVMMGPQLNQMHGLHGACSDGMALLNALLSVETADECAEEEV